MAPWKFNGPHVKDNRRTPRRMLKKAVQHGYSERKGRRAYDWYVEILSEARTLHGKRRVLARRGLAGEKSDFFSILLIVRGNL